jgi:hypothetical protein
MTVALKRCSELVLFRINRNRADVIPSRREETRIAISEQLATVYGGWKPLALKIGRVS